MNNPVLALVWESWRLSRRWYLWVLPVAFALDYMVMRQASELAARGPLGANDAALIAVLLAPAVLMLNFSLAIFATLLAVSLGNKSGFPFHFEFRLPVPTPLLVGVPMLTLAALCASLYCLPMLVFGLLYGIPFPLVPAAALIATMVIILVACSWSTTSSGARTFAVLLGLVNGSQLFAILDPVDTSTPRFVRGQEPVFNHDMISLAPGEYAALALIGVLLYAMAVASIRSQRYGEAPSLRLPGLAPTQPRTVSVGMNWWARCVDAIRLPCPTTAPWRAELWLEFQRNILPILLLSVLISACVPVLYLLGITPPAPLADADYIFPNAVFFVGIGMTVFNRRRVSAGYMSAFEGTRGMSTLALAAIQVLAVAAATLLGIALVCVSVHFASGLVEVPGNLELRLQQLLASMMENSPAFLLSAAFVQLASFLSAVMLLVCIHTWSVVWGRWVPYGAGMLAIYGTAQIIRVQSGTATLQDIKDHMWAIAICVFMLTFVALARTLHTKVLSLRVGLVALAAWGLYVGGSLHNMALRDIVFTELPPEMQALRAALLLSPLLLFVLLLWSYDRLRHQ